MLLALTLVVIYLKPVRNMLPEKKNSSIFGNTLGLIIVYWYVKK